MQSTIGFTPAEASKAVELSRGKVPHQCATEAEACEKDGAYIMAAIWWRAAQYVTIGHSRTAMYEGAEREALRKAGR